MAPVGAPRLDTKFSLAPCPLALGRGSRCSGVCGLSSVSHSPTLRRAERRSPVRNLSRRVCHVATVKRGTGKRVANFPGVNDAVKAEAERRAGKVRSAAVGHRLTGEFQNSIKVQRAPGVH
ncbi:DUF5403 family protein, partial [Streptomyces katsurahamanus]|uniref:DUF5403 family protein n=1 Tax=Streptomyces katsurahamanus TaxID=2577098 RepID=UPI00389B1FD0